MDKELNDDLGAQIAAARKAARLSKEAAARAAGVTTTTWRRAEAGLKVHDHKLAAIMTAVGMPSFAHSPVEDSVEPFTLPVSIEAGYTNTVDFTRAVAAEVPELSQKATRLMLDASALFAAAGEAVYKRSAGGDGNADATGGSAPTSEGGLYEDQAAYDPEKD